MKSILAQLHCRYCGYQTHKKSETLVLSAFEPKLREDILTDRFFHHECPCCHRRISFQHPLLYRDDKHRFIVLLQPHPKEDLPELQTVLDYRKRIVFTNEELMEKIRILEDGMNDVVIEHLKFLLAEKLQQKVRYYDVDLASDTLWFETIQGDPEWKAIPQSSYKTMEKCCHLDENNRNFIVINADSYKKFIEFR